MEMGMKSSSLLTFVVLAFVVQLIPPKAEARLQFDQATGTVYCTNTSDTTTSPPFPNASVEVICASNNTVGSGTTGADGNFSIGSFAFLPLPCRAVVTTPLSTCNATLPSNGTLVSPLVLTGASVFFPSIPFLLFNYNATGFVFTTA